MIDQKQINDFVAAAHWNLPRVQELLAQHPELLHARAEWDETPIQAATHTGNRPLIDLLLARGAPLDAFTAAVLGQKEQVAAALAQDPALARAAGVHGLPMFFFAALGGRVEIGEMLLAHGADVNAGRGGNTALHAAAMLGHADYAAWLLSRGADVNAPNYEKKTPLAVALKGGREAVASLLRQHGGTE